MYHLAFLSYLMFLQELKTQIRKLEEDRKLTVSHLGKQLSELIQVFKKQMLIVDNLKKQNVCIYFISII